MFEAESRDVILERLKKYYDEAKQTDVSTVEGTFSFDTLAANAKEFEKAYAEMDLIIDAAFPQTSWGKYLDYLAEELAGLDRRAATSAVAVLTVAGNSGAIVPKGSIFATESGVSFLADEDTTIPSSGTATVKATAQTAGAGGNVAAGTINKISVSIYGVSSVTNEAAAYDGYEEETDSALLERLLFAVRQPATSGNVYHYITWATSVSGVGAVKVMPLWNGNGTVKVVVVDTNKDLPSDDLLQEVRDVIAENAPIGATVTVVAPNVQSINISLKVTEGTGNADGIKTAVTEYLKKEVFGTNYKNLANLNKDVTVSYAQIGRIILDESVRTGVTDYSSLTVNDGTENLTVPADNLPVVGTVTLT